MQEGLSTSVFAALIHLLGQILGRTIEESSSRSLHRKSVLFPDTAQLKTQPKALSTHTCSSAIHLSLACTSLRLNFFLS
ncbi:hypothetical protein K432DRAFT_121643 [Lepidopterella palustris CBS 459.81]|uniref:Secreted protein n=1 Tax=Lepidopterella palustris CBS 459.81 TaxID=1314670 RepID=A0A8E2EII1_9PEZI|nr:hypothetical protein K432DRAFT_121643 [Lepidopterella palustris CBS 459.81]